jgi:hypothetical protein
VDEQGEPLEGQLQTRSSTLHENAGGTQSEYIERLASDVRAKLDVPQRNGDLHTVRIDQNDPVNKGTMSRTFDVMEKAALGWKTSAIVLFVY